MKYAFVFDGQGSQYLGMGVDLYNNFKSAKDVFDEVDEALKENLFKLMQKGPENVLTLTSNAQPAIMAVCVATLKVLEKDFGIDFTKKVSYVAGHSLGEYSAAVCAGVFSLSDTARLLRLRGEAMQKAVPVGVGGMVAVLGASFEDVKALAESVSDENDFCVVANDNATGQVVLSGHIKAVTKAMEAAQEFGAKKAVMLNVSAPFHSPLMESAKIVMSKALNGVQSQNASIGLIQNITAQPVFEKEKIIKNLTDQITGTVRWRETMAFLNDNNVTDVIEFGPSNILTSMFKREYKNIYAKSLQTPEDIEELANNL